MPAPVDPGIGSIIHVSAPTQPGQKDGRKRTKIDRECSMGIVLSVNADQTMLVEVTYAQRRSLMDRPGSSSEIDAPKPQMYLSLNAKSKKEKQNRMTWHWPGSECPWGR